ncbi:MAG: nucleotide exchange factor GrpE [Burkholderiaceae bacterium]
MSATPQDPSHPQDQTPEESNSAQQEAAQPAAADGAAMGADQPAAEPSSQDSLAHAQALLAEREDQLIRLAAEIENLRKRHAQELGNARKFAIEGFAEALLPVADSLETALSLQGQTLEGLTSGVELTLKQLQQAFEKGQLLALNPAGEKFDPNRHQAVSMVDGAQADPPVAPGHVVSVLQKGYLIGERVLRPALVAVAS